MNPNQPNLSNYRAYSVRESSDGSKFYFTTERGVDYIVYFTEADGYAPAASFAEQAKMFGFGPVPATRPEGKLAKDRRVEITLFEILYLYLSRYPDTILILLCSEESPWYPGPDHKNSRYARWRMNLFNQWYDEWQASGIMPAVKIDYELYGVLYCSCLFRSGNPYETEVRQVIIDTILAKQP